MSRKWDPEDVIILALIVGLLVIAGITAWKGAS